MIGVGNLPSGLVISPIFDALVLSAPNASQIEAAANAAIRTVETTFTGAATINLHIGWGEVGGSPVLPTLAAASLVPSNAVYDYNVVAQALAGRAAILPILPNDFGITLTLADSEASALGLRANTPVDGYVGMSSALTWDYSAGPAIAGGAYDFQDILIHEITHQMGRVTLAFPYPPWLLDRFRYAAPGTLDATHNSSGDYFSIDGGVTRGYTFESSGDDSDWAAGNPIDAFGEAFPGLKAPVSPTDLTVMGAIGWNVTSQTDFTSDVRLYYDAYFGRDPTPAETQVWQGLLGSGRASLSDLRQTLISDPSAASYVSSETTGLYQTFLHRDPTAAEVQYWASQLAGVDDVSRIQAALIADPQGGAIAAQDIRSDYLAYFGRAASASEVTVWEGLLSGGDELTDLTSALSSAPEGVAHVSRTIASDYETYLARAPTVDEQAHWTAVLRVNGDDFSGLRAALSADPSSAANIGAMIVGQYETYFGRDPSTAEVTVWRGLVAGGADSDTLRAALVTDPAGQAYTAARITALYDNAFGRDPTAAEIAVWSNLIAGGDTFGDVQGALFNATAGVTHRLGVVAQNYETFFGRDATAQEQSVWQGILAGNSENFGAVRAALLSDAAGQSHTAESLTYLYDTYFGRDPTPGEISVWQGLIAGGADFISVRTALLSDPSGAAHTAAAVTQLYESYFGRDPTTAELGVWSGLIAASGDVWASASNLNAGADDFAAVRGSLMAAAPQSGSAHPAIASLYEEFFDRAPTSSELATWDGQLAAGKTLFQLQATLMDQGLTHVIASGYHQSLDFSGSNMVVDERDLPFYLVDPITLSRAEFGQFDPYDPNHERQFQAADGSNEVLIMLDATHSILLEHATLSSTELLFH